jgi:hypothetical protein
VTSGKGIDAQFRKFFTDDGNFFGFRLGSYYEIYRTSDGSALCTLDAHQVELCFSYIAGTPILMGIIDKIGNKFYKWSMRALTHLSVQNLTLFYDDMVDEFVNYAECYSDSSRNSNWLVLGSPMPALFPEMFKTF